MKRLLLFCLVLLCLFFCGSVSLATDYWDGKFDTYMNFLENTKTLTNTGLAGWNEFIIREQSQLKTQITSKLNIGIDDCKGFLMSTNETANYAQLFIITVNNGYEINVSNQFVGGSNVKGVQVRMWKDANNLIRIDSTSTSNMGTGSYTGVMNTAPTNDNYYNAIINVGISPQFDFLFATNYHVNLNGVDCLAYILPYSFATWNLGQCQNWEDLDELVFYLRDENDIILYSTTYTAQEYFNHPMHIYDNGFLYIVSRLLNYRQVYKLEWEAWQGGSMVSNYYDYICFLPPKNTVVDSNGNVTQIGSGDYTTQDSTNDIIEVITASGDPEFILSNDLFSGDSGEIYARFGYQDYNNPYKDFILRVFYGIMTTLTSSGNVNLIWPIQDQAIILRSDDFVLQSITFRILLSGVLVFFILYKLYGKLKILLDELAEGNINYTLNFKDGKFTEYWFF